MTRYTTDTPSTPPDEEADDELFKPPEGITKIAQGICAMTRRKDEPVERPDPPARRRATVIPTPATTTVYIAGAVHTPPPVGGPKKLWVTAELWVIPAKTLWVKTALTVTETKGSAYPPLRNNPIRNVDMNSTLTIFSTQKHIREAMNKKLSKWEHKGWAGTPHCEVLKCLAAGLKARKVPTIFKMAEPGTPERMMCRQATILAKGVARTPESKEWDLTIPIGTALPGLSLQGNRQRIFYCSIREEKTKNMAPRPSTMKSLELVQKTVEDTFGRYVSDTDVWRAVYVKDILPRTAQFLWKGLHNAHRISKYWTHIPECEDCTICKACNTTEDLAHILVKCQSPGQEIIWKAAESLWLEKETQWPAVSLGTILGCGLAEFRDKKNKLKHDYGMIGLYPDGEQTTEDEIVKKWKYAINQQLQVDKILANRPTKGKRPTLAPQLVLATWSDTLDNEQSLPADWLREPRVLVGSCTFPKTPTQRRNSRGIG
ncbi:hypothetical protein DFH08DRAFT_818285 [Mycena albidolilacea]|uniref:Reverse transcriptase zinc-binding domain-containing protein n=1 Tax=Mycena albidolilacea TaxID=1033008 RepID=A0AAD7EGS5_9AGAR|nr:hypothetical protein DFH08DRAFT_818285 [Mycena albidolilacea]